MSEEEVFETLLMADLDILEIEEEDGVIEIEGNGFDLDKIQQTLLEANEEIEIIDSDSGWYAQNFIELSSEEEALFNKFLDLANEVEDIQEIYHNILQD